MHWQLKKYKKAIHFAELSRAMKKLGNKLKNVYSFITLAILMSRIEIYSETEKYIQKEIKIGDKLNDLFLKKNYYSI